MVVCAVPVEIALGEADLRSVAVDCELSPEGTGGVISEAPGGECPEVINIVLFNRGGLGGGLLRPAVVALYDGVGDVAELYPCGYGNVLFDSGGSREHDVRRSAA